MNDKVDWDKAIEYVCSNGDIYPCEHLGADSKGQHAVLVHFDGGSQLRICLEIGQNPAWGSHVRNKREYECQWLIEHNYEGNYVTSHRLTAEKARAMYGDRLIRPIEETKREVECAASIANAAAP